MNLDCLTWRRIGIFASRFFVLTVKPPAPWLIGCHKGIFDACNRKRLLGLNSDYFKKSLKVTPILALFSVGRSKVEVYHASENFTRGDMSSLYVDLDTGVSPALFRNGGSGDGRGLLGVSRTVEDMTFYFLYFNTHFFFLGFE